MDTSIKRTIVAGPNSTFVYYLTAHLTKQDTWNGPKGVRIREVPFYCHSTVAYTVKNELL